MQNAVVGQKFVGSETIASSFCSDKTFVQAILSKIKLKLSRTAILFMAKRFMICNKSHSK